MIHYHLKLIRQYLMEYILGWMILDHHLIDKMILDFHFINRMILDHHLG